MATKDMTPEAELAKLRATEKRSHLGIEVAGAVGGAAVGAVAGSIAGPPGAIVGAIMGAAIGGAAGLGVDDAEHAVSRRGAELDAEGLAAEAEIDRRRSSLPAPPPAPGGAARPPLVTPSRLASKLAGGGRGPKRRAAPSP